MSPVSSIGTTPAIQSGSRAGKIRARRLTSGDESAWTTFLELHPRANLYHTLEWRDLIEACFGQRAVYLLSEREGAITGVLPLFLVRHPVFGSKLLSLPYDIGSGGSLTLDALSERALVEEAIAEAQRLRVKYLELRPGARSEVLDDMKLERNEPVIISDMTLEDSTLVWDRVSRDHTKAIRKARNRGVEVRRARTREDYRAFYRVYLNVFRGFGTPPYARRYFDLLFDRLHGSGSVEIFLAFVDDRCVGGLQLFGWGRNLVSKFAACLPEAVPLRAYPALYAEAIRFGLDNGYRSLSWGTSSPDQTGLIEFKEGWGAQSRPAVLYSLPVLGAVPDLRKYYDSTGWPQQVWKRLPLVCTRMIGPPLNRWFC